MRVEGIGIESQQPIKAAASVMSYWTKSKIDPEGEMDLKDILRLIQPGKNKVSLLWLLKRFDWFKLIELLSKDQLIFGLHFLHKDKLLALILRLPPKFVIKMMLYLFSPEKLVQRMNINDMMRIFRAPEMDHMTLLRGLQWMEPKFQHHLLSKIYGGEVHKYRHMHPSEIRKLFFHAKKRHMLDAFKTLPYRALMPFMTNFINDDHRLLEHLSLSFVTKLLDGVDKGSLMDACRVLPDDMIIRMLGQLPDKLLVQVAAQLDDKMFMDYLMSNQAGLLRSLAAA